MNSPIAIANTRSFMEFLLSREVLVKMLILPVREIDGWTVQNSTTGRGIFAGLGLTEELDT